MEYPQRPFSVCSPAKRPFADALEFGRNAIEGVADAFAQGGDGADDDDGNEGGDQRVFDSGNGALVDLEFVQFDGERGADIVHEHGDVPFKKSNE